MQIIYCNTSFFQNFGDSRDLPFLFLKNGNIKKKIIIENLIEFQQIVVHYSE